MFGDRREAGQQLAQSLAERGCQGDGLLMLGIPRGGVPVADEVARTLHTPLDVVISRKRRAPHQPKLAIGAVVSGDHLRIINEELAQTAMGVNLPGRAAQQILKGCPALQARWRYRKSCWAAFLDTMSVAPPTFRRRFMRRVVAA